MAIKYVAKPFLAQESDFQKPEYSKHFSMEVLGTTTVEKKTPVGVVQTEEVEKVASPLLSGTLNQNASVMIGASRTVNLGNYESAKISVAVTLPCEVSSISEIYEFGVTWVNKKMEEALTDNKKGSDGNLV